MTLEQTPLEWLTTFKIQRDFPNNHSTTFILVEGNTDMSFFEKLFGDIICIFFPIDSKQKIIQIIEQVNNEGFLGCIGIVDSDFENLEPHNSKLPIKNLFHTDFHDIEIYVWDEIRLKNILQNYCTPSYWKKHYKDECEIRDKLTDFANVLGHIRYISQLHSFYLFFKYIDFEAFIQGSPKNFHLDECLEEIVQKSKKNEVFRNSWEINRLINEFSSYSDLKDSITSLLTEERLKNHNPLQICNGHDIMHLFWICIIKEYCNSRGKKIVDGCDDSQGEKIITDEFFKLYKLDDFKQTNLFDRLSSWVASNNPYKIFSNS